MKGKENKAQKVQTVSTTAGAGTNEKVAGVTPSTVVSAGIKGNTADPAGQRADRMRR